MIKNKSCRIWRWIQRLRRVKTTRIFPTCPDLERSLDSVALLSPCVRAPRDSSLLATILANLTEAN